jgi:hypothetical protein
VLGLTYGEFGLVAYITLAIVMAKYFPALGQRVALLFTDGNDDKDKDRRGNPGSS